MATQTITIYIEPETGKEYRKLPDPWQGRVSPLNAKNCEQFGWTIQTREEKIPDPEPEPTQYSKLKLIRACKDAGLWTQVKAQIEAADYWDEFVCAQELSTDDAGFMAFVATMRTALGDDTVNQILEASAL